MRPLYSTEPTFNLEDIIMKRTDTQHHSSLQSKKRRLITNLQQTFKLPFGKIPNVKFYSSRSHYNRKQGSDVLEYQMLKDFLKEERK